MFNSINKPVLALSSMALATMFSISTPAFAEPDITFSGELSFGLRHYISDGLYAGQSGSGIHPFIELGINSTLKLGAGDLVFEFESTLDNKADRSHQNLKKLHYTVGFDTWDILVGYNVENWGVAESQTIMNVLNSLDKTDPTSNIGADRIGTPMINANIQTGIGTFSGYALLDFVQPNFGSKNSRGRSLFAVNDNRDFYEGGNDDDIDIALRYTNNFAVGNGSLDFSAMYFNGFDRNPTLLPGCIQAFGTITEAACNVINTNVVTAFQSGALSTALSGIVGGAFSSDNFWDFMAANATNANLAAFSAIPGIGLIPYYQETEKVGVTAVYATGNTQLRFEGVYARTSGQNSFSTVFGGDYTWNNFAGRGGSLTLAAEYLFDNREDTNPFVVFGNDIFVGVNYNVNNARDTRLQAGVFVDLHSAAQLYTFSMSSRLTDSIRVELNGTVIQTDGFNDPLAFIEKDDFVEVKFTKYF